MIKVMFWNIKKKKSFENIVCDVVKNEKIDILLLAEAGEIVDSLIETNSNLKRKASPFQSDQRKLTPRFYSNNKGFQLNHFHTDPDTKRMVFHFLDIPAKDRILLCGLHLRSKLMRNTETQLAEATITDTCIEKIEEKDPKKRTIVFGDFNVNPFESGMISPIGFNATLSKVIAQSGPRKFIKEFEYFYNPMWNFTGDIKYENGNLKLPGSYYFKNNDDVNQTFWNLFDNLIIRPNLTAEIDLTSITLLENSGTHKLVNKVGEVFQIDSVNYSDHLPLIFNIKL